MLKRLQQWCIETGVGIIPRYIRSARNISADDLTRRGQYECEQWMYAHGMHCVDLPELRSKWEQRMEIPPLNTFELSAPMYQFYQTYRMRIAAWRSKMFGITRILHERDIPPRYIEIENRAVFRQLHDSAPEYTDGDIFLLIWDGGCRMEMDDSQLQIRQLRPICAIFLCPGWTEDNVFP